MKSPVVQHYNFQFCRLNYRKIIEIALKIFRRTSAPVLDKMAAINRRKRPEQIRGLKHLLERTNRFYSSGSQRFPGTGEESEAGLVLEIKIDPTKAFTLLVFYDFKAFLTEVFLKSATARTSFLMWLLRETLIFVLKFFSINLTKVMYFTSLSNVSFTQRCNST